MAESLRQDESASSPTLDLGSDVEGSESEDESVSDQSGETEAVEKLPKLSTVLRATRDDMSSLAQVSLLIRQPGYERRYIHTTRTDDLDPSARIFADLDYRHVKEKFRSWNPRRSNHRDNELSVGPDQTPDDPQEFSKDQLALIKRLAKANTKRREQLLYWSRHPDRVDRPFDVSQKTVATAVPGAQKSTAAAETAKTPPEARSDATKTVQTRNTFSIGIGSDPNATSVASVVSSKTYEKSILQHGRSNQVPSLPLAKTEQQNTSFMCPYCYEELSESKMRRRREWK